METDTAQLISDRDNAIQQIKKAVPDYPWDDNPPAPMSEAAYAACSTIEGIRLANDDWCKRAQELAEALRGTLGLIRTAQERLCTYLRPDTSDDPQECLNDLLELLDGPRQQAIEKPARAALALLKGD